MTESTDFRCSRVFSQFNNNAWTQIQGKFKAFQIIHAKRRTSLLRFILNNISRKNGYIHVGITSASWNVNNIRIKSLWFQVYKLHVGWKTCRLRTYNLPRDSIRATAGNIGEWGTTNLLNNRRGGVAFMDFSYTGRQHRLVDCNSRGLDGRSTMYM